MVGLADSLAELLSFSGDGRRDRALADGCMAAAALVGSADGGVSFATRAVLDQVIDALAARDAVAPAEAAETFDGFVDAIAANSSLGRRAALAVAAETDGAHAATVLRVARAVAAADGAASAKEAAAVADVAAALGLATDQASG